MYIVTFYSFRGGVGRTTALVNVGLELARRGRKVLLVDFDLESPDLAHFPPLGRRERHPGIVEYVAAYREKSRAPDVTEYLYPLELEGPKGGHLWVMPAGRGGRKYWEQLAETDWPALYEQQQGYLFFEDTRLQWEQLGPDYVLIDTHAGITPALGIATRQLPDAVVMVVPSHRGGRAGLNEVSRRIDREAEQTGSKPINQLFVATGLVETDDVSARYYENEVGIFDFVAAVPFSHQLLVGKRTFKERAPGPLGQEYRRLANALIAANFTQDRDGARVLLCDIHAGPAKAVETFDGSVSLLGYHGKLDRIIDAFPDDADIQAQAACCFYAAGRYDRALCALDRAIELRPGSPELLWQRASYRRRLNLKERATEDLLCLLDIRAPRPSIGPPIPDDDEVEGLAGEEDKAAWRFAPPEELCGTGEAATFLTDYSDPLLELLGVDDYVVSALWQLRQLSPERYEEAKQKPGVTALSPEAQARLFADRLPSRSEDDAPALIRAKKWADVVAMLQPRLEQQDDWPLADAIHLFLAWWGLGNEEQVRATAKNAKARFRCALRRREKLGVSEFQAMALVYWKNEEPEMARRALDFIDERVTWPPEKPIFSYWRFARVSWRQFQEDCALQRQMRKEGANSSPPFLGKEPTHRQGASTT